MTPTYGMQGSARNRVRDAHRAFALLGTAALLALAIVASALAAEKG